MLEKVQRPDADIPHMLSLGEEFNRAVCITLLFPCYHPAVEHTPT